MMFPHLWIIFPFSYVCLDKIDTFSPHVIHEGIFVIIVITQLFEPEVLLLENSIEFRSSTPDIMEIYKTFFKQSQGYCKEKSEQRKLFCFELFCRDYVNFIWADLDDFFVNLFIDSLKLVLELSLGTF